MTEILTPESPRWDQFLDALVAMLGERGCDGDGPAYIHRHAKTIMKNMGNVDIAGSLAYFEEHGGYCDYLSGSRRTSKNYARAKALGCQLFDHRGEYFALFWRGRTDLVHAMAGTWRSSAGGVSTPTTSRSLTFAVEGSPTR